MRWVALFEYSLLAFLNGCQWICLSVIPKETSERFNISVYQVNIQVAMFYFMFIFFCFFAIAFFDKYGVKKTLIVANAGNILGFAIKLLVSVVYPDGGPGCFPLLLLSSSIAGIAQVFFLPVPSALSAVWFADDERTFATTVAAVSNPLGGGAMFLLVGLFVDKQHFAAENFVHLFVFMTALNVADGLLLLFVVPELPEHPPSQTAHLRMLVRKEEEESGGVSHHQSISITERCRRIYAEVKPHVQNRDSLFVIVGTGLAAGTFWTFTTLIEQIAAPYSSISEGTIGWMGASAIFFGVPVSVVVSRYVDQTRVYKGPLLLVLSSITVVMGLFSLLLWAFPSAAVWTAAPLFVLVGGPQNLILPLGFEALSEITFPLNENVCSTLILLSSEVLALVLMYTLPAILTTSAMSKQSSAVLVCMLLVLTNCLAFVLVLFGKVQLNRKMNAELTAGAEEEDEEENKSVDNNQDDGNDEKAERKPLITQE